MDFSSLQRNTVIRYAEAVTFNLLFLEYLSKKFNGSVNMNDKCRLYQKSPWNRCPL